MLRHLLARNPSSSQVPRNGRLSRSFVMSPILPAADVAELLLDCLPLGRSKRQLLDYIHYFQHIVRKVSPMEGYSESRTMI